MKKLIVAGILSAMPMFPAQAAVLWTCEFKAHVSGIDAAFFFRGTSMWGKTNIQCTDLTNRHAPVNIKGRVGLVGVGFGPQIAIPLLFQPATIRIDKVSIGVAQPRAMFSEFNFGDEISLQLGDAQVAIGRGIGASVFNAYGAEGNLQLKLVRGGSFGLGIGYKINAMIVMTEAAYQRQAREREGRRSQILQSNY